MFIKIYFKIKNYLITAFFLDKNKKVIGIMKDVAARIIIIEFIGLRSKMYPYEINNETTKKKNVREYLNTP